MLDNDPSVPVSPEDVIGQWLIDLVAGTAVEADLILRLARAGFVVIPSEPDEGGYERAADAVYDVFTGDGDGPRCTYSDLAKAALDAFLAPYRSTGDPNG